MKQEKTVFNDKYVIGYGEITNSYIKAFSDMIDVGDYTPPEVVECMYKTLSKQYIKDMKKGKRAIKYNIKYEINNERKALNVLEKANKKAIKVEKRKAFKQRLKNIFNRKKKSNTNSEEIKGM